MQEIKSERLKNPKKLNHTKYKNSPIFKLATFSYEQLIHAPHQRFFRKGPNFCECYLRSDIEEVGRTPNPIFRATAFRI